MGWQKTLVNRYLVLSISPEATGILIKSAPLWEQINT